VPSVAGTFPWWACLVDVLTVARLTRLATRDKLPPVLNLRQNLLARTAGPWKQLWVCPWCMSPWIAVVVLGLHLLVGLTLGLAGVFWWTLACSVLAISHAVGLLADAEKV
jgi:hypothetical protein